MQRVAIGRALVRRPAVYLMDEPLSSLDAKLRADLRLELKHIQQDLGATILYVTHDQIEAMTMANRIGILYEGRLVQIGTPREIYESPRSLYVAARLGQPAINLIPAGPAARRRRARRARRRSARAPSISASPRATNGQSQAKVDWIEHLGDQNHLHVSVGEHKLVTLVDPAAELAAGRRGDGRARRAALFRPGRQSDWRAASDSLTKPSAARLIEAVARTVIDHADELTALDRPSATATTAPT